MVHKLLKEPPRGLKTFYIPSNEELVKLKVGDDVQVIFGKPYDERMWVIITDILKEEKIGMSQEFEGLLHNVPLTANKLKLGSKIKFNAKHIINIKKGSIKRLEAFRKELKTLKPEEKDYRAYLKGD